MAYHWRYTGAKGARFLKADWQKKGASGHPPKRLGARCGDDKNRAPFALGASMCGPRFETPENSACAQEIEDTVSGPMTSIA